MGTKTKASLGGHENQVGGKAIDPSLEIDNVAFPTTVWGSQAKDWPEVWTLAKDREAQPYSGGRIALIGIPLKWVFRFVVAHGAMYSHVVISSDGTLSSWGRDRAAS